MCSCACTRLQAGKSFECSLPAVADDLVVYNVLDEVMQYTTTRGEFQLKAVSFDRTTVVEAQLNVALVQYILERRKLSHFYDLSPHKPT